LAQSAVPALSARTRGRSTVRGIFCRGADKACLWLLLGTSLYLLAVTGAAAEPGGNSRYRLPVMPAVCILAAAGLPRAKTGVRRKSAGLNAEAL